MSKEMSLSRSQHGRMGAGAPAQTPSLLESSPIQGPRLPSHHLQINHSVDFHGEPVQRSFFLRVGHDVQPLNRVPYDTERELEAATAQPPTPVHQPHDLEHAVRSKPRNLRRGPRIWSPPVTHTKENHRLIQELDSHLRSIILFYFGNSEEQQLNALERIRWYLQQCPPIHICSVKRKNGDPGGMILQVTCLLCPPGPKAPPSFETPNPLPKFAHHFRKVHCRIKNSFCCTFPSCSKPFALRHDMTRHIRAAHPGFDGIRGIDVNVPHSVGPPNVAGPSNSQPLPPVVDQPYASPSPLSTSRHTGRVNPYPLQTTFVTPPNREWNTTSRPSSFQTQPTSSACSSRPSDDHPAGYMPFGNAPRMDQPFSLLPSMPCRNVHPRPYGASHNPVLDVEELMAFANSYPQSTWSIPPLPLNVAPHGVPIHPEQHHASTAVAHVTIPDYLTSILAGAPLDGQVQPRQDHAPSLSVHGLRQPMPSQTSAMDFTPQWQNANGTSRSIHHAEPLRHEANYVGTRDGGLAPWYMPPGNQGPTPSISPQTRHGGPTQQPQYQRPLQSQIDHNRHMLYPPWEHPQNPLDTGSLIFMRSSLTPRYPRTAAQSQTRGTSAQPPRYLGDNVSLVKGSLVGAVERKLPPWLGLIGLMVGVSEVFLSAILVSLGLPRDRKRCVVLFLNREGEEHNTLAMASRTLRRYDHEAWD